MEYPKMLYGKAGWSALDDCRMVHDADEEKAARKKGYTDLGRLPEAQEAQEVRPSDADGAA